MFCQNRWHLQRHCEDTLLDMHTELKAVPHAGLGYHFLRVQVRKQAGTSEWPTLISPDQMGVFVGSGPK